MNSLLNDEDLKFIEENNIDPMFYRCYKYFVQFLFVPNALFKTRQEILKMVESIYPQIVQRCKGLRFLPEVLKEFHFYFMEIH